MDGSVIKSIGISPLRTFWAKSESPISVNPSARAFKNCCCSAVVGALVDNSAWTLPLYTISPLAPYTVTTPPNISKAFAPSIAATSAATSGLATPLNESAEYIPPDPI